MFMGAMHMGIDRHFYLTPVVLRSFIVTGDPHIGVAVGLDFNTKIDGTTANLAILYVVLLRNRGVH